MVDPWIGETAADNRLVAFNPGNTLPVMAIGRLPVNSVAEAQTVVSKILAYEQNPPAGDWRSRVAFVADNAYGANGALDPAGNFWQLSDMVADDPALVPATLTEDRLYLNICYPATYPQCNLPNPPYPPYTSGPTLTVALTKTINSGRVLVNYVGHGVNCRVGWLARDFSGQPGSRTHERRQAAGFPGHDLLHGLLSIPGCRVHRRNFAPQHHGRLHCQLGFQRA